MTSLVLMQLFSFLIFCWWKYWLCQVSWQFLHTVVFAHFCIKQSFHVYESWPLGKWSEWKRYKRCIQQRLCASQNLCSDPHTYAASLSPAPLYQNLFCFNSSAPTPSREVVSAFFICLAEEKVIWHEATTCYLQYDKGYLYQQCLTTNLIQNRCHFTVKKKGIMLQVWLWLLWFSYRCLEARITPSKNNSAWDPTARFFMLLSSPSPQSTEEQMMA